MESGGASSAVAAAPHPGALVVRERSDVGTFEPCDQALAQALVLSKVMECSGGCDDFFIAALSKVWKEHYRHLYPARKTLRRRVVESVERLSCARKYGYELSIKTFEDAAQFGDVSVCKALHSMGCAWDKGVCKAAVSNERHGLSILQWLRTEDLPGKEICPWNEEVSREAARQGRLEMLEWLLTDEVNASFDSFTLMASICSGRISVVEWVLHHPKVRAEMEAVGVEDYRWSAGAFWAAHEGNLEMLQWLHANARDLCGWDTSVCFSAVRHSKSLSMLKWLRSDEVMCPWHAEVCPQKWKDILGDAWDMPPAAFEEMKQWVHANGHPCNCED